MEIAGAISIKGILCGNGNAKFYGIKHQILAIGKQRTVIR